MSRTIQTVVSDELYDTLMKKIVEVSMKEGHLYNRSSYLKHLVEEHLNGSKNVSQAAIDTDSKQKNNPDNSKPPENVSDPPDDTSKSPWKVFNMDDMYDDQ